VIGRESADIAATVYQGLNVDPATRIPGPDEAPQPITEGKPIHELFQG